MQEKYAIDDVFRPPLYFYEAPKVNLLGKTMKTVFNH